MRAATLSSDHVKLLAEVRRRKPLSAAMYMYKGSEAEGDSRIHGEPAKIAEKGSYGRHSREVVDESCGRRTGKKRKAVVESG